jgi:hypothetical protein
MLLMTSSEKLEKKATTKKKRSIIAEKDAKRNAKLRQEK